MSENQEHQLMEKDKEIKLVHIKLREFLQKNIKELPDNTFEEIETIITGRQPRKMADTYKRLREIANKRAASDLEMDTLLTTLVAKNSKRALSNVRPRQLEALVTKDTGHSIYKPQVVRGGAHTHKVKQHEETQDTTEWRKALTHKVKQPDETQDTTEWRIKNDLIFELYSQQAGKTREHWDDNGDLNNL